MPKRDIVKVEQKKAYEKPKAAPLGDLKKLTRGAGPTGNDAGGGGGSA